MSDMERIASFSIDHLRLERGIYVSRVDGEGATTVTTFDLRMRMPNREPVMDMAGLHTIEHLGATYLRNCPRKDEIVYFGPMGCRTGCYLVMFGKLSVKDVYELIIEMCRFILSFEGEISGAKAEECGNYLEHNLNMAKYYTKIYLDALQTSPRFDYPTLDC